MKSCDMVPPKVKQPNERQEMKLKNINRAYSLDFELLDSELEMVDMAISKRRSHLRAIDELGHRDSLPKSRRPCPTHKKRYRDAKEAEVALRRIANNRKRSQENGVPYNITAVAQYQCQCGYVHISSRHDRYSVKEGRVA